MSGWEFWIDVGGTFTDCLAHAGDSRLVTCKVLSSGVTKGRVGEIDGTRVCDPVRRNDPAGFWNGCLFRLFGPEGRVVAEHRVVASGPGETAGWLRLDAGLPGDAVDGAYELDGDEPAPLLAIRTILGLGRAETLPPVTVRLGTTRGTNALLTRRGARTAFVTTRGLADVLRIANQDRPKLFDLDIVKPEPLYEEVLEVDERLDARGCVVTAPDAAAVRRDLTSLRDRGIESLAICLLHAFENRAHEELVAAIAEELGFAEVSVSSRLAPLIKIVPRGETTVVDAYLNPVLRGYVRELERRLAARHAVGQGEPSSQAVNTAGQASSGTPFPCGSTALGGGRLRLMTSAGGLVGVERFTGKDSLLSGPAGGVIGFSRVAERAGFPRSIGFDMGGTSTDVSRYDGRYEFEYETKKAGVRVVTPMLAVETVAAGGGSVCRFDGIKLVVGPESAGANPGPACYGRGGPLTVTDVNVFLGKVPADRFPFPLDTAAVGVRLEAVREEMERLSPGSAPGSLQELAEGFVRIANANMVRPIRNISVSRGYDPREYVLVTFGGAGAQHACAIARELGMRQVLAHPLAGLLSAYGIGQADVRRTRDRSILARFTAETLEGARAVASELAAECVADVRAEGVDEGRVRQAVVTFDLRYLGVEAAIGVTLPVETELDGWRAEYERQHERLYGYVRSGRDLELVAVRVEVTGEVPAAVEPEEPLVERRPVAASITTTWFGGRACETGVFSRGELRAGDRIAGPAIVCESSSTVVIDPGFDCRVLSRGELLIEDGALGQDVKEGLRPSQVIRTAGQASSGTPESPGDGAIAGEIPCDPVLLEIFNSRFAAIAEGMGLTLQRTSCSTNVKERLDFSCALFDPSGNLVVNAPHIPVHLGAMGETVRRVLADNPDLGPGDVVVTNDPYRGGSHLPDVTVVSPVHDPATGELLFLTASRAHHAEIGGIVPGSMPPFSKNLGEEGVLIRNFRLVEKGISREADLERLLSSGRYPSRNVRDNLADVAAQVAANRSGAIRLLELVASETRDVVRAYMRHIQAAAERKMRLALSRVPDGVYARTDHLDDGSPISVRITKTGEEAVIDFTGTGPVVAGNLNANRAIVTAAVLYVFRCLLAEEIPLNAGVLAPLRVILPECLLNPPEAERPEDCPAIVGGNVETSQRVVDVLLGALKLAAGSQGTMNNFTFGDGTFGYYETICGGAGATARQAGADAVHTHMTNTRLTDVEVIERRYPVRIREFAIRRGSGGAGRHRGGDGIVRRVEFLKPLSVSLLTERRGRFAPYGLEGGGDGMIGRNLLTRADGSAEDLGGKKQIEVRSGDVLVIETPGGGGWGRP